MIKLIKEFFEERAGRRQAEHAIKMLMAEQYTPSEMEDAVVHKLREGRTPFRRGYIQRWAEEGYNDAKLGMENSNIFQNDDYEYGWTEGMADLKKRGFVHEAFNDHFESLINKRNAEK